MVKQKKTSKQKLNELVDSINQVNADAEGVPLKEYYKRQAVRNKAQAVYAKTHWVQPLTDAQKFFIVTTTDVPHHYMDLPLSKGNETAVAVFKKTNKNYQNWVIKNNEFMNKNIKSNKKITSVLDNMKKATEPLRKFKEQLDQATAPLKKMQKDYQEIGRKLRFKSDRNNLGIMSLVKANKITGG